MNPIWLRTIAVIAVLAGIATLFAPLLGVAAALCIFALSLVLFILRDKRHLIMLWRWAEAGRTVPLPPASGMWDDLFAKLYTQSRANQRQQAALTEALVSFRRAAQALPEGVINLDGENHIIWCNAHAEEHFGLKLATDAGQNIANLLRTPDFLAYLFSGEWDLPIVQRIRGNAPGQEHVYSIQLVAYGDAQKLLLSRNITKIEKLETMRRDFVANVSHELKTPLTVLAGFLETIQEMKLPARQQQYYLSLMSEQATRMQQLVSDLLTLSALEANNAPLEESIDIQRVMDHIEQTAHLLSGKRHTLEFYAEAGLKLTGSESEISSALTNLVTNAIRYTPDGGRISVKWSSSAESPGFGARFSVTDTGIGIEAKHIARLTERFYRVDRSRSRDSGGTGLGLAIVKHVLTRHQGKLEIESKLGEGSRFSALFPQRRLVTTRTPADMNIGQAGRGKSVMAAGVQQLGQ